MKLFDAAFILKNKETGEAIANHPYRIKREDGSFEEGITDEHGHTHLVSSANPESLVLELITLPLRASTSTASSAVAHPA